MNHSLSSQSRKGRRLLSSFFAFLLATSSLLPETVFAQTPSAPALKGYYHYDVTNRAAHMILKGQQDSEQFGASFVLGDINGDGFSDLAVSSPTFSSGGKIFRGKVSVFIGHGTFFDTKPTVTFLGASSQDQLGTSLILHDLNQDGYRDLVIGSLRSQHLYVMFGDRSFFGGTPEVDFFSSYPNMLIHGPDDKDNKFGFSLDVLDWNHDGIPELFVSAPGASNASKDRVGKIYGFSLTQLFLRRGFVDLRHDTSDFLLQGRKSGDQFGATLVHGDFNGDRIADLAVGSYLDEYAGKKQAGTVFVFFGKNGARSSHPQEVLDGDVALGWFGYSLSAGDIDHDGASDLLVTSFPFNDGKNPGSASIFFGTRGSFDLKTRRMDFINDRPGDVAGTAVAFGDANGDGAEDILIGSPALRTEDRTTPGKVSVFTHFDRHGKTFSFSKEIPDLTIFGNSFYDWFGSGMLFEDLNNDGRRDLLVSAPSDISPPTPGGKNAEEGTSGRTGSLYIFPGPLMPRGELLYSLPAENDVVTRGSLVDQVVRSFELPKKYQKLLTHCWQLPEACLFDFTAQSRFSGIKLDLPVLLYPDIQHDDPYYSSVNIATILGLVRGYYNEKESPFHPQRIVSRIDGLKVVLQAISALQWKEKAELKSELGGIIGIRNQRTPFVDVTGLNAHMWWYPRYVNYARLTGIIDDHEFFAPDEPLTQRVLLRWIENAKRLHLE